MTEFDIEAYIRSLEYGEDTDEYARTLVAGNLRNLYRILGEFLSERTLDTQRLDWIDSHFEYDDEYQVRYFAWPDFWRVEGDPEVGEETFRLAIDRAIQQEELFPRASMKEPR